MRRSCRRFSGVTAKLAAIEETYGITPQKREQDSRTPNQDYESRNFRDHGHPSTGCDVIVCWRHNWEDCPTHMEVLELSTCIKSVPNPDV